MQITKYEIRSIQVNGNYDAFNQIKYFGSGTDKTVLFSSHKFNTSFVRLYFIYIFIQNYKLKVPPSIK